MDECCEHCGYPAASGHPSDCIYWQVPQGITYTIEEGQLVRLYHARPEQAWLFSDAPRWAMRELFTWLFG